MQVVRKDAAITNTGADDDFPGTFEVILSAPTLDRDGDTLLSEDWKQPLPDHITFDIDHGMTVASTVGSGTPTLNDAGQLVVSGTYSSLDRAQDTRTLVKEGHIRTTSVAFMSDKATKDGKTRVTRELLNGAFVAIPSNREAVVLSSKAATIDDSIDHLVQALAKSTRAEVVVKMADGSTIVAKAVAGSYEQRQQALSEAIDGRYPGDDMYAWPMATFDDSVVYRVGGSSDLRGQWQCSYTVADDGVITLGEPSRVQMVEQVVPATRSAGSDQTDTKSSAAADESTEPAADPAAGTGDDPAAAEPDDVGLQLRALSFLAAAQAAE